MVRKTCEATSDSRDEELQVRPLPGEHDELVDMFLDLLQDQRLEVVILCW